MSAQAGLRFLEHGAGACASVVSGRCPETPRHAAEGRDYWRHARVAPCVGVGFLAAAGWSQAEVRRRWPLRRPQGAGWCPWAREVDGREARCVERVVDGGPEAAGCEAAGARRRGPLQTMCS
jgi:hypothetical protein